MKILALILHSSQHLLQFIMEDVAEVFSLDHDDYSATGMVTYSGTIHRHQ